MKIILKRNENEEYVIEFKSPTEEDFAAIDGPDIEGQISDCEVYCDRKLNTLGNILSERYGYRYRIVEP